jgi:hypothetical protein
MHPLHAYLLRAFSVPSMLLRHADICLPERRAECGEAESARALSRSCARETESTHDGLKCRTGQRSRTMASGTQPACMAVWLLETLTLPWKRRGRPNLPNILAAAPVHRTARNTAIGREHGGIHAICARRARRADERAAQPTALRGRYGDSACSGHALPERPAILEVAVVEFRVCVSCPLSPLFSCDPHPLSELDPVCSRERIWFVLKIDVLCVCVG